MSNSLRTSTATRRLARLLLAVLVPAALCSCHSSTESKQPMLQRAPTAERARGEYIVTVKRGTSEAFLRHQYASYGVRGIENLGGDMFLLKLAKDPGADVVMRRGRASGKVQSVQQNYAYRATP